MSNRLISRQYTETGNTVVIREEMERTISMENVVTEIEQIEMRKSRLRVRISKMELELTELDIQKQSLEAILNKEVI